MSKLERLVIYLALIGQVLLIAISAENHSNPVAAIPNIVKTLLPIVLLLSFSTVIIVIRDLYKREFENSNSKLTWLIVVSITGGIGLLIYIFKFGNKSRDLTKKPYKLINYAPRRPRPE